MHWFSWLQDIVVAHAGAWWTYALTAGLCVLDGFFPPVPSESLVIAMAALSSTHGGPVKLWVLWPLACLGAYAGDSVAYWIGRLIPLERIFRTDKARHRLERAEHLVQRRGPEVLISARFIPVYRVAINMMAGSIRFPYRRFLLIDIVSTVAWAVFSVGIGLVAGSIFHRFPLLGIVAGVALGLILGVVIDKVGSRLRRHDASPSTAASTKDD